MRRLRKDGKFCRCRRGHRLPSGSRTVTAAPSRRLGASRARARTLANGCGGGGSTTGSPDRGAVLKLPNRKICKRFNNYSGSGRGDSRPNDFVTKRCSGFGTGQKRMLPAARQNVGFNPQPHASAAVTVCPSRSSPRWPPRRCELLRPSSRRGPRQPRRSGRSQPSSRKGPNGRGAFADFEVGQAGRCAVPGGANTPGRKGRPGSRGWQGSGCTDAEDPRCPVFRTRKDSFSPVDDG